MKRPRFSLRRLLAVVSLVAIAFAAVRLFKQSPFALPDSAAQVLVDCGSRRLECMWIVAVDGDRHVALAPYHYKFMWEKMEGGAFLWRYEGRPLGRECDIFVEWRRANDYLFVACDKAQRYHVWELDGSMLTVEDPAFGRTTVTIAIPDGIASESPSQEFLEEVNFWGSSE